MFNPIKTQSPEERYEYLVVLYNSKLNEPVNTDQLEFYRSELKCIYDEIFNLSELLYPVKRKLSHIEIKVIVTNNLNDI